MTLNPYKLREAFLRAPRVKGVSVPPSIDRPIEVAVERHVVGLWRKAANAALKLVPLVRVSGDAALFINIPQADLTRVINQFYRRYPGLTPRAELFIDASQVEFTRVINQVYRRYSGLTSLNERLKREYEQGNEVHKARYVREMDAALGTGIGDLLNDTKALAEVDSSVRRSIDLIKTLDEDLKNRLAREIWLGVSEGKNRGSLREFILKNKADYPKWRAKLIARDQTAKLFSNLSRIRQEDVGITGYIWRTVGDGAVRNSHAALDGKRFNWDAPPSVGHPGDDYQCRCIADPDIASAKLFA